MDPTNDEYDIQHTTAWLSTTASQIFFMQLGFLCYEVGFVKAVWTQSVILKNIEDTFVGVLTFLAFGHTLADSPNTFHGIISVPENPLLIGVPTALHDQILIAAFFASTCATIISGAVLERMKNKAYISWCLLTILVNYSFVAHWVWHPDGWLAALGFVDGAGSVVVHSTAGMASLVAVWKLGARRDSLDADGNLLPTEHAANPIINAIGAFFLWYGWFAFNVASPIAYSRGIGDAIGTTALVTVISPISGSCAAFLWMALNLVPLDFESLLNCLLAGLVSITGMCHTVDVWSATFVGFFSSAVYFSMTWVIRKKWKIDDPLQVVAIHLFCGIYSGCLEGVVANDVYGEAGLIHGGARHFGVQCLGVAVIVTFNFIVSWLLWELVLVRVVFRNEDIRVSILDIYLGTRLFDQNYDMALNEVLNCNSNAGKKMLYQFHRYVEDRYASEQLDFLICSTIFANYLSSDKGERSDFDAVKSASIILQIIATYVDENGPKCINVSGTQRSILMKIKKQLIFELKNEKITHPGGDGAKIAEDRQAKEVEMQKMEKKKTKGRRGSTGNHSHSLIKYQAGFYKSGMDITKENVFDAVYKSVWKIVIPHFVQFLKQAYEMDKKHHFDVKIPFEVEENWMIEWDEDLTKCAKKLRLLDTVPQINDEGALLNKVCIGAEEEDVDERTSTIDQPKEDQIKKKEEEGDYPIIFVTDKTKKDHDHEAVVVIE
eukprot:103561_1